MKSWGLGLLLPRGQLRIHSVSVLEKALQMSLSVVAPHFVPCLLSQDNSSRPVFPLRRNHPPVKLTFGRNLEKLRDGGGRKEGKPRSITTASGYFADISLPGCEAGAPLWCWSGTNLDDMCTKGSVEGPICSRVEKKPCDGSEWLARREEFTSEFSKQDME